MFCKRHPTTAAGVVLALLLFTSADLLGDFVGFAFCSSDSSVELHEAIAHDDDSHESKAPVDSSSHPEKHHVEDCFCCSHCVQHTTEFVLMRGETVALVVRDGAALHPPLFVRELFRPPQAS